MTFAAPVVSLREAARILDLEVTEGASTGELRDALCGEWSRLGDELHARVLATPATVLIQTPEFKKLRLRMATDRRLIEAVLAAHDLALDGGDAE